MADKNEPAPMTRPTLPGLVAEWKLPLTEGSNKSPFIRGANVWRRQCAAELSQAVALTDEEREAIAWMDTQLALYPFFQRDGSASEFSTIRALLARTFPAAGGEGEGNE